MLVRRGVPRIIPLGDLRQALRQSSVNSSAGVFLRKPDFEATLGSGTGVYLQRWKWSHTGVAAGRPGAVSHEEAGELRRSAAVRSEWSPCCAGFRRGATLRIRNGMRAIVAAVAASP